MISDILPNMRLLALPSEVGGKDWFSLCQDIDSTLEGEGLDLAEESVYLLFSDLHCKVARSVIGPKKIVPAPLELTDWIAAPVLKERVNGDSLEELLASSEEARLRALEKNKKIGKSFILCIRRHLVPELQISVEVIFSE